MRIAVFLAACVWVASAGATEPLRTDHLTTTLVSQQSRITAGQPLLLGLLLEHDPHWHTYWQNPGDSGLPTRLSVQVGQGEEQEVSPLWPLPARIPLDQRLVNFGYEGRELLPFLVTVPAQQSGPLTIRVRASWLVCQEACIPGQGEYQLTLPLEQDVSIWQADFDRAARRQPRVLPSGSEFRIDGDWVWLRIPRQTFPGRPQDREFFPVTPDLVRNSAEPHWQRRGRYWETALPKGEFFTSAPAQAEWLLVQGDDGVLVTATLQDSDQP